MKAAYIHNCLKNGETPVAGPLVEEEEGEGNNGNGAYENISIPVPSVPPSSHDASGEMGSDWSI